MSANSVASSSAYRPDRLCGALGATPPYREHRPAAEDRHYDAECPAMAIVVRLGPLPLQRRGPSRVAELERIFGTAVQLIEVFTVAELATAVGTLDVLAVALDAPPPGQLAEAIAAVGALPKLRPLWRRRRNTR